MRRTRSRRGPGGGKPARGGAGRRRTLSWLQERLAQLLPRIPFSKDVFRKALDANSRRQLPVRPRTPIQPYPIIRHDTNPTLTRLYSRNQGSPMVSRRTFLNSSAAALATRLFAAPADAKKPNPELDNLGAVALREAKKLKASYCDIRIIRYAGSSSSTSGSTRSAAPARRWRCRASATAAASASACA